MAICYALWPPGIFISFPIFGDTPPPRPDEPLAMERLKMPGQALSGQTPCVAKWAGNLSSAGQAPLGVWQQLHSTCPDVPAAVHGAGPGTPGAQAQQCPLSLPDHPEQDFQPLLLAAQLLSLASVLPEIMKSLRLIQFLPKSARAGFCGLYQRTGLREEASRRRARCWGAGRGCGARGGEMALEQGELLQHCCPSDQVTSCAQGSESHRGLAMGPSAPHRVTKGHRNHDQVGGVSCKSGFFLSFLA